MVAIVFMSMALWARRAEVPRAPLGTAVPVGLPVTPVVATRLSTATLMSRLGGVEQWVFVICKYLAHSLKDILEGVGPLAMHTQELGNEVRQ